VGQGQQIITDVSGLAYHSVTIPEPLKARIALPSIGVCDASRFNGGLDKTAETLSGSVANTTEANSADTAIVLLSRNHDESFARSTATSFAWFFTSDIRLVDFNCSGKLITPRSHHGLP
jgi:hypothetical protein